MNMTCLSIIILAVAVCVGIVLTLLMHAGYGYEDEHGYHDGMPGGE
jgi:preprotein translocase subunit SecG